MNQSLLYSTGVHIVLLLLLFIGMKPAVDKKQATYTIDFIGSSSQAMRFGVPETAAPAKAPPSEIKAPAPPPKPKPAQPTYNAKAQIAKTPPKTPEPAKPAPEPPKETAPPAEEKVVLGKPSILGEVASSNIDPSSVHALEDDGGNNMVRANFTNFPYPWYITLVRNALWKEWSKRMPKKAGLSTLVSFTIDRNGAIYSVHIEQPSGNDSYDYAATSAVNNSAPFPPLPKEFPKDILTVTVEFKNVD